MSSCVKSFKTVREYICINVNASSSTSKSLWNTRSLTVKEKFLQKRRYFVWNMHAYVHMANGYMVGWMDGWMDVFLFWNQKKQWQSPKYPAVKSRIIIGDKKKQKIREPTNRTTSSYLIYPSFLRYPGNCSYCLLFRGLASSFFRPFFFLYF